MRDEALRAELVVVAQGQRLSLVAVKGHYHDDVAFMLSPPGAPVLSPGPRARAPLPRPRASAPRAEPGLRDDPAPRPGPAHRAGPGSPDACPEPGPWAPGPGPES